MNTELIAGSEPFDFQTFYIVRERALGRIFGRMKRYLNRHAEQQLSEMGFTDFKASYIAFLGNIQEEGITNNELARRAGVTKQAMSKVVKLLEDEGYIYTVKNERDSRSSRIFMNDRGKQLMKAVHVCMEDIRRKFVAIAGKEQVEQMIDTMVVLVRELENEIDQIPGSMPACAE